MWWHLSNSFRTVALNETNFSFTFNRINSKCFQSKIELFSIKLKLIGQIKSSCIDQRIWFGNIVHLLMVTSFLHFVIIHLAAETIWMYDVVVCAVAFRWRCSFRSSVCFVCLRLVYGVIENSSVGACYSVFACRPVQLLNPTRLCWFVFLLFFCYFIFSSICRFPPDRAVSFSHGICSVLMVVSISWFCFHFIFIAFGLCR